MPERLVRRRTAVLRALHRKSAVQRGAPAHQLESLFDHASAQTGLVGIRQIMQLQRLAGNRAVSRMLQRAPRTGVIQRKPADINNTYTLDFDDKGVMTNVGAGRSKLKRATIINAHMRSGWVTPKTLLTGGHLFKREFGGPDDETNVVPWMQTTEDNYTKFEDEYHEAAKQDAADSAKSSTPFSATIKTKATFADRPDLDVSESQLDKAGWTSVDPLRPKRKKQFEQIADQYSGIPTDVEVKAEGLSKTIAPFSVAGTAIAPAYALNPDSLKPGFTPFARFKRNATEPRLFTDVDWSTQKDKQRKSVQHATSRHGDQFGLKDGKSGKISNLKAMETLLKSIVAKGEQIEGTYRARDVLHYLMDDGTNRWLCTTEDGDLVAAFPLGTTQYDSLTTTGQVR